MVLKLVATIGHQKVTLPRGRPFLVGRAVGSDLSVRDPTVSRRHAELELEPDGLRVRDLGSTNGTFLNGDRLDAEVHARSGDQVAFGRSAFEVREERDDAHHEPRADPLATALDATILRERRVSGKADIAARVSEPTTGTSHLRVGGVSLEERQAKHLALLLDIAKELSGQPDLDRLLDKVVDLTFQVMSVDRVAVLMRDGGPEGGGELQTRASRSRAGGGISAGGAGGPGGAAGPGWRVPREIARKAVEERLAVLVENAPADAALTRGPGRESVQSAMCAPLLAGEGEALGLIYLDSVTATHSFSEEDLDFLTSFAGMVAVAIENGRLVERARREAVVLSNFQRYFAPELAGEIAGQQGEIRLGGAKRRVVALFSDIRGFTALSEALSPDEIAALLNEYFTVMVEIVFEHGGTLDKFMGDALMAIWGAPIARLDDADRAMRAAVGMQHALEGLNREWGRRGRRPLAIGIGLNLGEVFAGNIGSARRLEYTVIGDAVNTAAGLCAAAGPGEVLVSEALCRALSSSPEVTPLAPLPLKGKAQAVPVYRVEWRGVPVAR